MLPLPGTKSKQTNKNVLADPVQGYVEPIAANIEQEVGYTLDWLPVNHGPDTKRQTATRVFDILTCKNSPKYWKKHANVI